MLTCLFAVFVCMGAAGENAPKLTSRTISIPSQYSFIDWSWNGSLVASSEVRNDNRDIVVLRVGLTEVEATGVAFQGGTFPLVLTNGRLAYAEQSETEVLIRVASIDSGKLLGQAKITTLGQVGELVYGQSYLWLYGSLLGASPDDVRILRIDPETLVSHAIGSGYYPRAYGKDKMFFVDQREGFSLRVGTINSALGTLSDVRTVHAGDVYAPQLNEAGKLVVVQSGSEKPEIVALSVSGERLKTLSDVDGSGSWPGVSPSGRYVAYVRWGANKALENWISIVDLEGRKVYEQFVDRQPTNVVYRWAPEKDVVGIVTKTNGAGCTFTIVSIE